ncbi:hypothetical protein FP73_gp220 [Bacillus phage Hoody T]|uniref:Uncharacterized protein n=1 Tax=Bacillus phage Hoody T TaxID=1486660 RepID=A0A024B349_9CAUD|nr:hypothetical protein FP73_gp220 [Bacillus phage Hoody T]AHZ10433.1 hypothetical protein [Bacillus phage Hoody T]
MQTKVTDYIEAIIAAKLANDGKTLMHLRDGAKGEVVDLYDVAEAIFDVTNDIIIHIDTSQAINEARLRLIVEKLSEDIQLDIYDAFDARGDELFK